MPISNCIRYKYVVDDNWTHNPNESIATDEAVNLNNVIILN
jgi:hypothetical protein